MALEPPFDTSLNNFTIDAGEIDTFEITGTKMEASSRWALGSQQNVAAEIKYYDESGTWLRGQDVPSPPSPSNPDTLTVTVDFSLTPTAVLAVMKLGLYSFKYYQTTIYTINITK